MLYNHAPNGDELSMCTTATKYIKIQHLSNSFKYSTISSSINFDSVTIPTQVFVIVMDPGQAVAALNHVGPA